MRKAWQGRVIRASILGVGLFAGSAANAFDYFEHRYLGNKAYEAATGVTRQNDSKLRADLGEAARDLGFGRVPDDPFGNMEARQLLELPLEFGDLSALAGDFTSNETELGNVLKKIRANGGRGLVAGTRQQWFSACRWLYQVRPNVPSSPTQWNTCFDSLPLMLLPNIPPKQVLAKQGYRPDRAESAAYERIARYVSLASHNRGHFPRYSWDWFVRYHARAVQLARCYSQAQRCVLDTSTQPPSVDKDLTRSSLADCYKEGGVCILDAGASLKGVQPLHGSSLLTAAILSEAFAQHYLQDSFASGHIGSDFGFCTAESIALLCIPTKQRLKETHDALNGLGVDVHFPHGAPSSWSRDDAERVKGGWTAYGDDHLFVPEGDFHRIVVVRVAADSFADVLGAAVAGTDVGSDTCPMCTTDVFPVPSDHRFLTCASSRVIDGKPDGLGSLVRFELQSRGTTADACADEEKLETGLTLLGNVFWTFVQDERSLDPRVSSIPIEGWKVNIGWARQFLGPSSLRKLTADAESGFMLRLDYVRGGDPAYPNVFGFEYRFIPTLWSESLVSFGYTYPWDAAPLWISARVKIGMRVDEPFTVRNPTQSRRRSLQITIPSLEATYDLYPPFALFVQINALTFLSRRNHSHVDEYFRNTASSALGLRFDFSAVQ